MDYTILYFSGTGNTALIASEIAKRLKQAKQSVELISIEDQAQLSGMTFENKIVGFGFPVYKFSYPEIFDKLFPAINQLGNNTEYFLFTTYARFDAEAQYDFIKKLDKTKFKLIARDSFKAPSCGISARKPADDYEYESVMFFESNIKDRLDAFAAAILSKEQAATKPKHSLIGGLKKRIVTDIEHTKYPKLMINQDRCVNCGLCVKNCPDQNLIQSKTQIDMVDDAGCLHCLRCINHCPQNAISFGLLTEGENQYRFKTRDALFQKAADGYREAYWDDFKAVIKQWQRNTLQYWLKHRHSPE